MNIQVSNIGKIRKADIELNGLTVIAGENDTGKSTIGKLLFSIVKSVSRYEQDLLESKEDSIIRKIERLYFNIRREPQLDEAIKDKFQPRNFINELKNYINGLNQPTLFGPQNTTEELRNLIDSKIVFLKQLSVQGYEKNKAILEEIFEEFHLKEERETTIKKALEKTFFSEFYSELSQKNTESQGSISCSEIGTQIFDISVDHDSITAFKLYDDLFYEDVTFIETPLLLQMYDLIKASSTLFDRRGAAMFRPQASFHIKDLILKIEGSRYYTEYATESHSSNNILLKKIKEIIKGSFSYQKEEKDFLFEQNISDSDGFQIKPINTASGIKAFGIIELLVKANIIDERKILIIDEPENHLHPKWQVEYAKIIVEMVKNDVVVILSSHSPYMIQAIKYYSDKEMIDSKTSFYLSEIKEEHGYAEMKNVTDDLNAVFRKLAEPFSSLVWKK